jgi:hypothetical protein
MSLAGSVPKTHPERLGSLLRGAAQLIATGVRQVVHADAWPHDAPGYGQWTVLEVNGRGALPQPLVS